MTVETTKHSKECGFGVKTKHIDDCGKRHQRQTAEHTHNKPTYIGLEGICVCVGTALTLYVVIHRGTSIDLVM